MVSSGSFSSGLKRPPAGEITSDGTTFMFHHGDHRNEVVNVAYAPGIYSPGCLPLHRLQLRMTFYRLKVALRMWILHQPQVIL